MQPNGKWFVSNCRWGDNDKGPQGRRGGQPELGRRSKAQCMSHVSSVKRQLQCSVRFAYRFGWHCSTPCGMWQSERQTDSQTDEQTDRETGRKTERQTDSWDRWAWRDFELSGEKLINARLDWNAANDRQSANMERRASSSKMRWDDAEEEFWHMSNWCWSVQIEKRKS